MFNDRRNGFVSDVNLLDVIFGDVLRFLEGNQPSRVNTPNCRSSDLCACVCACVCARLHMFM